MHYLLQEIWEKYYFKSTFKPKQEKIVTLNGKSKKVSKYQMSSGPHGPSFCIVLYGQGGEINCQILFLFNRNCTTQCLRNYIPYSQVCNRHSQYHNKYQLARLNFRIKFHWWGLIAEAEANRWCRPSAWPSPEFQLEHLKRVMTASYQAPPHCLYLDELMDLLKLSGRDTRLFFQSFHLHWLGKSGLWLILNGDGMLETMKVNIEYCANGHTDPSAISPK